MAVSDHVDFNGFMKGVHRRNPDRTEFARAFRDVADALLGFGVV